MRRRLLLLSLCLLLFGCGSDMSPKQLDEPCTRTAQCAADLACVGGVCSPAPDPVPDAGVDGGVDAGS